MWLENAVSEGHPGAMYALAVELERGRGFVRDKARALALYKQAAELGDMHAQHVHGEIAFGKYDWRRYYWWGQAAASGHEGAAVILLRAGLEVEEEFRAGKCTGRCVFELGSVFRRLDESEWKSAYRFVRDKDAMSNSVNRCIALYDECCVAALAGVLSWLAVGRRLKVVKDIRQVIAKLLWAEKAAWSETITVERTTKRARE